MTRFFRWHGAAPGDGARTVSLTGTDARFIEMDVLLVVLVLTVVLFLLQESLRFAGPWVAAGLYLMLPAALTAYWLRANDFGLFPWIKVYTVLFCACYGSALRFTSLGERRTARGFIIVLLALNILEAAILGLIEGGLANVLNAGAAVALIATLPRNADAVRVAGRERDLNFDLSPLWVVGYTVWNWAFVYLNYPEFAAHHVGVLTAALLVGVVNPRRWLQTRAYTLGGYFIAVTTFSPSLLGRLESSAWSDPVVGLGAAVISVLVAAGCVGQSRAAARPYRGECLTRACAA